MAEVHEDMLEAGTNYTGLGHDLIDGDVLEKASERLKRSRKTLRNIIRNPD